MKPAFSRIASIDILRGIAITGMILCANIGFSSGLPAWMFHAQTPPPTYAFNPDVPGITWVDLVFPFFLFSMGAAFPLAMRKRLECGMSRWKVAGGLVKRWFILTAFGLILGNAYALGSSGRPEWSMSIFRISLWTAMFLSFVRVNIKEAEGWKRHIGTAVNLCGVAMLVMLGVVLTRWFGVPLNRYKQTFNAAKEPLWDAAQAPYTPDIVVIYLGTNDFSTGEQPLEVNFRNNYIALLKRIKANYGDDTPILCMGSPANPYLYDYIRSAVIVSGLKRVAYMTVSNQAHNYEDDLGASWHPNYQGHIKVASCMIPYISTLTGWKMEPKVYR